MEMDTHEPGPDAGAYVPDGESGATALAQRWNSPLLVDVNERTLSAVFEHPGLLESLAQIEDFRALVDNAEHDVGLGIGLWASDRPRWALTADVIPLRMRACQNFRRVTE